MAALIVEAARAARQESQQLRFATHELRFAMRRSAHGNRARLAQAEVGLAAVEGRRTTPSPWSDLEWLPDDKSLERILLPLD